MSDSLWQQKCWCQAQKQYLKTCYSLSFKLKANPVCGKWKKCSHLAPCPCISLETQDLSPPLFWVFSYLTRLSKTTNSRVWSLMRSLMWSFLSKEMTGYCILSWVAKPLPSPRLPVYFPVPHIQEWRDSQISKGETIILSLHAWGGGWMDLKTNTIWKLETGS